MTFRGNRLRLNLDTGSMGTAFVELRDDERHPIPGFTIADCEEIGGDFIDQQVYWQSNGRRLIARGSADSSALQAQESEALAWLRRPALGGRTSRVSDFVLPVRRCIAHRHMGHEA